AALLIGGTIAGQRCSRAQQKTEVVRATYAASVGNATDGSPVRAAAIATVTHVTDSTAIRVEATTFKSYWAEVCFFAVALLRKQGPGVEEQPSLAARSERQRALHACEMASAQRSVPAPDLDRSLHAMATMISTEPRDRSSLESE